MNIYTFFTIDFVFDILLKQFFSNICFSGYSLYNQVICLLSSFLNQICQQFILLSFIKDHMLDLYIRFISILHFINFVFFLVCEFLLVVFLMVITFLFFLYFYLDTQLIWIHSFSIIKAFKVLNFPESNFSHVPRILMCVFVITVIIK